MGEEWDNGPGPRARASFAAGLAKGSPILIGILPFGLIYGAAAKAAGLSLPDTVLMSLTVFAGSSQLVFVGLWQEGVNAFALTFTVVVVNLRLLIYGSSLAPFLGRNEPLPLRVLRSYALTDESYAISMAGFVNPGFRHSRTAYYLGCAFPTWIGWQCSGIMGHLAGSALPESVPLRMAVPLVFLSLLVSVLSASPSKAASKAAAALGAGLSAILLSGLPYNLGLIAAIAVGVLMGSLVSMGRPSVPGPGAGPKR
ncbi:MAG: AzlC family ABC transporter permease [Deltaproteobacteria bacterium]|jgi:4-azaleucine resistance transporter AzlC|nr:AzlC family ABC transporter permease [Deltaproteobacteria bacterium]